MRRAPCRKVTVTKFHVAHDCGQIINPDGLRNQIEGNAVQTVSRTLIEGSRRSLAGHKR
jgi:CO/xanthine dehydrogenase Mo-binding subunit